MAMQRYEIKDEAEWLAKRKGYVTSTEAAGLFGIQAAYGKSAFELWHVKKGGIEEARVENDYMMVGKMMEETICQIILKKNPDWKIEAFPYFIYDDEDKIGSSFDRKLTIGSAKWLMEIKSISYRQYKEDFIEHDEDDIEAKPCYEVQMQVELECAEEFEGCLMAVFILDTRTIKYIWRRRDKSMSSSIRSAVREFWAMEQPPAPDYAKDKSILASLSPFCDPNRALDATEDNRLTELAAQYKNEKDLEKRAKKNADAIYAEIMHKLGNAKFAWTNLHKITASDVKENKGKLITPEMVGTYVGGKKGFKKLTITAINGTDEEEE